MVVYCSKHKTFCETGEFQGNIYIHFKNPKCKYCEKEELIQLRKQVKELNNGKKNNKN